MRPVSVFLILSARILNPARPKGEKIKQNTVDYILHF